MVVINLKVNLSFIFSQTNIFGRSSEHWYFSHALLMQRICNYQLRKKASNCPACVRKQPFLSFWALHPIIVRLTIWCFPSFANGGIGDRADLKNKVISLELAVFQKELEQEWRKQMNSHYGVVQRQSKEIKTVFTKFTVRNYRLLHLLYIIWWYQCRNIQMIGFIEWPL